MSQRRKKQKIEKSVKDPVAYFDSRRIPFDVWDEIFQYTTGKDLLRLSLVCKNFYVTIGDSPDAMEKIMLKVDINNTGKIVKLSRIYTNIKFQLGSRMEACFDILQKYGPKLRVLEIDSFGFNEKDIIDILELVRNSLKTLSVNCFSYISPAQREQLARKTFKLMKLEILVLFNFYPELSEPNSSYFIQLNSNRIMKNLLDVLPDTVLEVYYSNLRMENESFLKFLENQKNLKYIKLQLNQNNQTLNKIDDVKFKLDAFEFCSKSYLLPGYTPISKFLVTQSESLKYLKLENVRLEELYAALKFMPNLQVLEIVYGERTSKHYENKPDFYCPSLKKLILNFKFCDPSSSFLKFLERFSNVEIAVTMMKFYCRFFENFAKNHHQNIKKLVLNSFKDCNFRLVSLKFLSELIINENTKDLKMDYAAIAMENLKVLKIDKINLQNLLWILVNFKKLKHLEIKDGSHLVEINLCKISQHFKDLRFLKINRFQRQTKGQIDDCLTEFPNLKYSLLNEHHSGFDSQINGDNYDDYDSSDDT